MIPGGGVPPGLIRRFQRAAVPLRGRRLHPQSVPMTDHDGVLLLCGNCREARGFADANLVGDPQHGMAMLVARTPACDRILTFCRN